MPAAIPVPIAPRRPRLVMIGNGMAGVRTLEELLKLEPDHYDVTVFGAEPHPAYNRIMLSPVLTGEQNFADIVLNPLDWYQQHGVNLRLGERVVRINRARREVHAADGSVLGYDRLLLATGSTPFVLPVPGNTLDGVLTFRDIHDVENMIARAQPGTRALVIGGGLLGLEAACGLAARGMDTGVVHLGEHVLDRQLDRDAALLLQRKLAERGLRFLLGRQTQEILDDGNGRVCAVRFDDGSVEPTDLVVMAAGIRPHVELARDAGLQVERGIVVTDTLQTSDPRIYAVGECASHRGVAYGLVAPLYEQARVAANHLACLGYGRYSGSSVSAKLKVTGIDLFSAGDFQGDDKSETITLSDAGTAVYKRLVIRDDKLIGACLYGDTGDAGWYGRLIREGTPLGPLRQQLVLGEPAARPHLVAT